MGKIRLTRRQVITTCFFLHLRAIMISLEITQSESFSEKPTRSEYLLEETLMNPSWPKFFKMYGCEFPRKSVLFFGEICESVFACKKHSRKHLLQKPFSICGAVHSDFERKFWAVSYAEIRLWISRNINRCFTVRSSATIGTQQRIVLVTLFSSLVLCNLEKQIKDTENGNSRDYLEEKKNFLFSSRYTEKIYLFSENQNLSKCRNASCFFCFDAYVVLMRLIDVEFGETSVLFAFYNLPL